METNGLQGTSPSSTQARDPARVMIEGPYIRALQSSNRAWPLDPLDQLVGISGTGVKCSCHFAGCSELSMSIPGAIGAASISNE